MPVLAVHGLHNDPAIPLGEAAVVARTVLAASDRVGGIAVRGQGGHAARPHLAINPVLVGSRIVVALQAPVSRRTDPLHSAVVSITQFRAGSAGNVIPETAELHGTVRTLRPGTQDTMERLIAQAARNTAAAHDAEAVVRYVRGYPPTVNHAAQTERAALAAGRVLGQARVLRDRPPMMGGEDFSFMLRERPGCFVKVGQRGRDGRGGVSLHNPGHDSNDEMAPVGSAPASSPRWWSRNCREGEARRAPRCAGGRRAGPPLPARRRTGAGALGA